MDEDKKLDPDVSDQQSTDSPQDQRPGRRREQARRKSGLPGDIPGQRFVRRVRLGKELGGILSLTINNATAQSQFSLSFTESAEFISPLKLDDSCQPARLQNWDRIQTFHVPRATGLLTQTVGQQRGGFRFLTIVSASADPLTISNISLAITFMPHWDDLRAYPGYFFAPDPGFHDIDCLTKIWYAGAHYRVQTNTIPPHTARQEPCPAGGGWSNDALGGAATGPILVDGAKRDRNIWPGDCGISTHTELVALSDMEPTKNSLMVMFRTQNLTTGALQYSGPPLNNQGSDTYISWSLIGTHNYFLYTGDLDFIKSVWANYTKAVGFLEGQVDLTGLMNVSSALSNDWGRASGAGHNSAANALLYRTLVTTADLATHLGNVSLPATYLANATKIKTAFNSLLWDAAAGRFRSNDLPRSIHPQDGNALAVLYNLTTSDAQNKAVSAGLMKFWTPIRPWLRAHFVAGKGERAIDLIEREWGYMLETNLSVKSPLLEGFSANGSLGFEARSPHPPQDRPPGDPAYHPAISVLLSVPFYCRDRSNLGTASFAESPRIAHLPLRSFRKCPGLDIAFVPPCLGCLDLMRVQIAGMAEDLDLTGMRYQMAAAAFFVTYALLEAPCNVVAKCVRPSIWIPGLTLAWGIIMVSMAFVKTWRGLIIARVFLGVAESGLAPALALYVTCWYCRDQQARGIASYFSAATLAGAFGGLLAFCIEKMNGIGGLHGWSWIASRILRRGGVFVLIEFTVPSRRIAHCPRLMLRILGDSPSDAKFLSSSEKSTVIEALKRDAGGQPSHFEMRFVWQTVFDPLSWMQAVLYVGLLIPLYSFTLFLPTIISSLGFSSTHAQLLTIPPYAAACAITIPLSALSDRVRLRGPFLVGSSLVGIFGYVLLICTDPATRRGAVIGYVGCIAVAVGLFPPIPIAIAWGGNNAPGSLNKAVLFGLVGMAGNLGGICASFVYRTQDAPKFRLGHAVALSSFGLCFIMSIIAMVTYERLNRRRLGETDFRSLPRSNTVLMSKTTHSNWDPFLLISQIVSMQSLHYLTLSLCVPLLLAIFAEPSSLHYEGGAANVGMVMDWREMAGQPTVRGMQGEERWNAYTSAWSGGRKIGFGLREDQWDGRTDPMRGVSAVGYGAPDRNPPLMFGGLVLSIWYLYALIRRPRLILDFALTLVFNHLVLTTYYSASIPTSLFFWSIMFAGAAIMIIVAEQLCVRREMAEGLKVVVVEADEETDEMELGEEGEYEDTRFETFKAAQGQGQNRPSLYYKPTELPYPPHLSFKQTQADALNPNLNHIVHDAPPAPPPKDAGAFTAAPEPTPRPRKERHKHKHKSKKHHDHESKLPSAAEVLALLSTRRPHQRDSILTTGTEAQPQSLLDNAMQQLSDSARQLADSEAQRRALESLSLDRAMDALDTSSRAQEASAQLHSELAIARMQLEAAQAEIERTKQTMQMVKQERDDAEREAADARSAARKMRMQMVVRAAKEQGEREGWDVGFGRGKRIADALKAEEERKRREREDSRRREVERVQRENEERERLLQREIAAEERRRAKERQREAHRIARAQAQAQAQAQSRTVTEEQTTSGETASVPAQRARDSLELGAAIQMPEPVIMPVPEPAPPPIHRAPSVASSRGSTRGQAPVQRRFSVDSGRPASRGAPPLVVESGVPSGPPPAPSAHTRAASASGINVGSIPGRRGSISAGVRPASRASTAAPPPFTVTGNRPPSVASTRPRGSINGSMFTLDSERGFGLAPGRGTVPVDALMAGPAVSRAIPFSSRAMPAGNSNVPIIPMPPPPITVQQQQPQRPAPQTQVPFVPMPAPPIQHPAPQVIIPMPAPPIRVEIPYQQPILQQPVAHQPIPGSFQVEPMPDRRETRTPSSATSASVATGTSMGTLGLRSFPIDNAAPNGSHLSPIVEHSESPSPAASANRSGRVEEWRRSTSMSVDMDRARSLTPSALLSPHSASTRGRSTPQGIYADANPTRPTLSSNLHRSSSGSSVHITIEPPSRPSSASNPNSATTRPGFLSPNEPVVPEENEESDSDTEDDESDSGDEREIMPSMSPLPVFAQGVRYPPGFQPMSMTPPTIATQQAAQWTTPSVIGANVIPERPPSRNRMMGGMIGNASSGPLPVPAPGGGGAPAGNTAPAHLGPAGFQVESGFQIERPQSRNANVPASSPWGSTGAAGSLGPSGAWGPGQATFEIERPQSRQASANPPGAAGSGSGWGTSAPANGFEIERPQSRNMNSTASPWTTGAQFPFGGSNAPVAPQPSHPASFVVESVGSATPRQSLASASGYPLPPSSVASSSAATATTNLSRKQKKRANSRASSSTAGGSSRFQTPGPPSLIPEEDEDELAQVTAMNTAMNTAANRVLAGPGSPHASVRSYRPGMQRMG
ncbi:unnamed protein product [Mycena citricolor]|uniref:Alpha-L-rhamnosidase six-hairpin glycosidase domain-containing protein n=1 Tax=Mycena citricolor TaxID=2018698 RepID=A0AAD2H3C1_9AGAR|nr:unnamed protein product [Mycena citricolor]